MNTNHLYRSVAKIKVQGYTLYEMIIVLSVIGVLTAAAFPMVYSSILLHNQDVTVQQLKSIVKSAQEEATRGSGASIIICAAEYSTSNGTNTYLNDCASDNSWSEGILAFTDLNSDGNYATGERIKALRFDSGATVSAVTFPGSVALNRIYALPSGLLSDANNNEAWLFTVSQTKYGQSQNITLLLNNYGYFCRQSYVGQDNGSTKGC